MLGGQRGTLWHALNRQCACSDASSGAKEEMLVLGTMPSVQKHNVSLHESARLHVDMLHGSCQAYRRR